MAVRTTLTEIPPGECEELLAAATLGRLAVIVGRRPEVFPVNHVYDPVRGCVAFPTDAHTKLDASLMWPWVAYEVDGEAPDGLSGWSVLVAGRAEEITDVADVERLAPLRTAVWQPAPTAHWLRVVPTKVTGRRVRVVDLPGPEGEVDAEDR